MNKKSLGSKQAADKIVKTIRRKTRQTFSAEEKIRIVLAGLRGEESIAALCRREGIAESLYYKWSKEFLEAGKGGDRDFVELLMLVQQHDLTTLEVACELAVEQNTLRLPAIVNLINQLLDPVINPLPKTHSYPQLQVMPKADCKRYEMLYAIREDAA